MASPERTGLEKPVSVATSHFTGTAAAGMPWPISSGRGARRVQMTKPSGSGSPEATPSWNG